MLSVSSLFSRGLLSSLGAKWGDLDRLLSSVGLSLKDQRNKGIAIGYKLLRITNRIGKLNKGLPYSMYWETK